MKDKINDILMDMQNNKLDVGEASNKIERLINGKVERPSMLPIIDTTKLVKVCFDHIEWMWSDDYYTDNDFDHTVYEAAMEAFYGDDIFEKINKRSDEVE